MQVSTRWLPFADAATAELPLLRLLRLGLFQVSVGLAIALLNGTLNRVMIVELHISSSLIAAMVALPVLVAPLRALVGVRSDAHRSVLGWRRVPYLWFGTLLQFGGLAILPFALILLSGDTNGSRAAALIGAALAFTLVGIGVHTTQTAGLALATDLAPAHARPRAIALLHLQQLAGLVVSASLLGRLLTPFSQIRLIQVVQGAAAVTMALNLLALWKQEPRRRREPSDTGERPLDIRAALRTLSEIPGAVRLLVGVGLGAAAFGMQDILLEPYGGQVLHLGVGATSALTALTAAGSIAAFAVAARRLERGADPIRLAGAGVVIGIGAFAAVIFAAPLASAPLFRVGAVGIGLGGGLVAVSTLVRVMDLQRSLTSGVRWARGAPCRRRAGVPRCWSARWYATSPRASPAPARWAPR